MRIASLVPHATELLFALGLDAEVCAVTHECDYPAAALTRARVTRDVLAQGLSAHEIDAAVRERTLSGEAIYELDGAALAACEPELIVTQALCAVCAVSYEDVAAIARELPGAPRVIALDPATIAQTHEDARTLGSATGRAEAAERLVADAHARISRVQDAVRSLQRPRVLALEWLDPFFIAGHWTPEMISLAGGEDVAGIAGEHSRSVARAELDPAVLHGGAPDIVIVMPCGYGTERAREEALVHTTALARLGAKRVVAVDAAAYFSRPGPRLTDGVELLAHILHPGALPDPRSAPRAADVEVSETSR